MKKLFLILCLVALVTASAFAQKSPIQLFWVIDDSTDTQVWNIGVTTDSDTSVAFDVSRLPEGNLGFQFYWNAIDADTGSLVAILQQNIVTADYGSFVGFGDSAAAITYISSWVYVDSLNFGAAGAPNNVTTATGRGAISWNPTLTGPATRARLIMIRRSGTTARGLAIAGIRQY